MLKVSKKVNNTNSKDNSGFSKKFLELSHKYGGHFALLYLQNKLPDRNLDSINEDEEQKLLGNDIDRFFEES